MEKIKIVLVDDELTSRNTIKRYLENDKIYEVVADFQNGKTALEWLRKNMVDILLCDMQMPEINGVELMRNVHLIDKYLPIIAISGFDDFNYVRGSLVNGAANYLLKHELSKEYLINALEQVREQYRIVPKGKELYRKKGYCIYEKSQFNADEIKHLTENEKVEFSCRNVTCVAVSPDYKVREGVNSLEYKQDISKAVIDIVSQILGDNYPYIVYVTKQYHLMILISFVKENSMLFMLNTINNFVRRLQRLSIRMLDTTLSIVCGDVYEDVSRAIDSSEHMENLLQDKFYLGENQIVQASITKRIEYSKQNIDNKYWEQLAFEFENQIQSYSETIQEIFEEMERAHYTKEYVEKSCEKILQLMSAYGYLNEQEMQEIFMNLKEYEVFGQYRTLILDLLHKNTQKTYQKEKKQYSMHIVQVLEYVNQNYMNDISLEDCAEFAGCSYTSLSREFKRETGMRFVEYLNHKRVNKAKSLLIRKDVSTKEIVKQAGFRNYNYFFKVFKEIVGVTPSEFAAKK